MTIDHGLYMTRGQRVHDKADLMPDLVDQVLGDLARGVARFLASRDLRHSQMTTLSSG
jgi:hypothetical protein